MSLVVPNEGEIELLDYALATDTSDNDWYVYLFTGSAITPGLTDTWATYSGFIATTTPTDPAVLHNNWTVSTVNNKAEGESYAPISIAVDPPGATIYGYVVTNGLGGSPKVLWAEKFSAALVIPAGGGTVELTLKITLSTA